MNNTKTTKRALLSSVTAMLICVAMLIGTTFAWFTDTASTAVNKIQSGKLDVALQMSTDGTNWESAEDKTLTFKTADNRAADQILWEPGCTYELPQLRVVNNGNLALKYKIQITGINGDAKLNEVIDWTINGAAINLTEEYLSAGQPGAAFTIKGHMQETAGKDYQNLTIDGIGITVVATQDTVENDSYGNKYDKDATYEIPVNSNAQTVDFTNYATATEFVLKNYTDLKAFAKELNVNGKSFSGKTVKLGADIDLGNTEWTPIGQTRSNGTANYFQGTFDGDNHTIKNLAISASAWDEGANYAAGLFGFIDAGGATIKNLTIDGARVEGHHWTGAVVGYLTGTVKNCHVKNATVISTHANDDACGDKVGAVVGYINTGDSVVSGCTAYKCTIKAGRDAGQIVGCNTVGASVLDCKANEVTVGATGDCTHSNAGGNIKNDIVGRT